MQKLKLKPAAKFLIFVLILAIVGGTLYFAGALDDVFNKEPGKIVSNIQGTNGNPDISISIDTAALIKQTTSIIFKPNSDEFANKEKAYAELARFIDTAKILDGTIIQIEGNTSSDGQNAYSIKLSERRAKAIATYLRFQDIDPTRFIVVGNGSSKPVAKNDTEANRSKNRRTDIFFKDIGA